MDREEEHLQLPSGQALLANGQWLSEAPEEAPLADLLRVELRFSRPWPLRNFSQQGLQATSILAGWVLLFFTALPIGHAFGLCASVYVAILLFVVATCVALWATPSRWRTIVDIGNDGLCFQRWRSKFVAWDRVRDVATEGRRVMLNAAGRVWVIDARSSTNATRLIRVIEAFRQRALNNRSRLRLPEKSGGAIVPEGYRHVPEVDDQDWLTTLADGTLPLSRRLEAAMALAESDNPVTVARARTSAWASSDPSSRKVLRRALKE